MSVLQITQLYLGDKIISIKTDLHNGGKKERRKAKNNKTMLKILPFEFFISNNKVLFCNAILPF